MIMFLNLFMYQEFFHEVTSLPMQPRPFWWGREVAYGVVCMEKSSSTENCSKNAYCSPRVSPRGNH